MATLLVLRPEPPMTVSVISSARELPAGTVLTATDLTSVRIPPQAVPDSAVTDADTVLGRTLAAAHPRGSVLTAASTLGAGMSRASPDEVLVPFRVQDTMVVSLLRVGDLISVVGTTPEGTLQQVADRVRVAGLPNAPVQGGLVSTGGDVGAVIVVSTDRQSAQRLAAAASWLRLGVLIE